MSSGEDRTRFTLSSARALRDRADRVTVHAAPEGRPRRRYLAQQRGKLAARLLPALALFAVVGVATALVDVTASGRAVPRVAVLAEAFVAILLGGAAFAVPLARRSLGALVTLATASAVVALVGWAIVARTSAQPSYVMILPLVLAAFTGLVALPPRVTLALGVVGYASLLVSAPSAPIAAHVLIVASAVAGTTLARARRRQSLATFLRVERLGAAVSRMRRMQEQLVVVEKLEALRVLVGGMAHELNNALAVSLGSSQQALRLLDERPGAPGGAAVAEAIRRGDGGLARIRRTVDRLRRFAMAAEGMLEPADVGAMLDFALESAIGRARSGVIVDREYDAVGAIECHVAALAEALFQIARNAVEAMPGGGRIHARVRTDGDRVILAVADEGHGIPPDELAKVFDPFYSRAAAGSARSSRSGLGLSAVYGLVSALGGSVEVRSEVGKGTEIAIVMPRKRARDERGGPPR
jgi:signal transduction histidine kinase